MEKKIKQTIKVKKTRHIFSCDNCGLIIDYKSGKDWIEGAYQHGTNKQGGIGTWCSDKCESQYFNPQ